MLQSTKVYLEMVETTRTLNVDRRLEVYDAARKMPDFADALLEISDHLRIREDSGSIRGFWKHANNGSCINGCR
jgi:hypothetical protein